MIESYLQTRSQRAAVWQPLCKSKGQRQPRESHLGKPKGSAPRGEGRFSQAYKGYVREGKLAGRGELERISRKRTDGRTAGD